MVLALVWWGLKPPAALDRSAPPERFSEGRARDIVRHLSEDIGLRVNGTPGHRRAAEYLAAELRKIPGVEVETQEVSDIHAHQRLGQVPFVYRTINVLGRLPGKTPDAILLDAHFDTLIDSVGAADDAAAVAAVVEVLRILARATPLDRTLMVNLNGAEEIGLLGAAGFLDHPWAKDVRAYVYLEALPGGKAVLIGAGPGNPWLAKTYASTVAAPLGNVMAQELTQSGLLPFNGDFTPFHEAGLAGLDVAMVGDAWGVHTRLDRLDRLEPGGLQHMGDATLAVTRALSSSEISFEPSSERVVYYDLLGHTMLAYSMTTARILAGLALLGFVALLLHARRRSRVTMREVLGAGAWNALAALAAVLAALVPALLLKLVLRRPLGWFAHPLLVIPCFALPAAAAMLAVLGVWRRRALRKRAGDEERLALTAWMGSTLLWALLLLLATLAGVGMGYIPLYWVAGGTAGLLIATSFSRARLAGMLLALLPGAVVTIEVAVLIVANIVPMSGIVPPQAPADLAIALLVGLSAGLVGVVAFALPMREGGLGKAAVLCAILGVMGLIATALTPPYSASRPKRLTVAHAADGGQSALLLAAGGPDGMRPLLPFLDEASPTPASWSSFNLFAPPYTHQLSASVPAMAAPRAEVTATRYDAQSDTRQITLHLDGTSLRLKLAIPTEALLAWSLGPQLPARPIIPDKQIVLLEGVPETGVDLQLTLRGRSPVDVELHGIDSAPASSAEMQALARRLPAWVNLTPCSFRITRLKI